MIQKYTIYTLKCKNPYMIFLLDKFIYDNYNGDLLYNTWYRKYKDYENSYFKNNHKTESSLGIIRKRKVLYTHYFDDKETKMLHTSTNIILMKNIREFLDKAKDLDLDIKQDIYLGRI